MAGVRTSNLPLAGRTLKPIERANAAGGSVRIDYFTHTQIANLEKTRSYWKKGNWKLSYLMTLQMLIYYYRNVHRIHKYQCRSLPKYCRYGVKHYIINQSINQSINFSHGVRIPYVYGLIVFSALFTGNVTIQYKLRCRKLPGFIKNSEISKFENRCLKKKLELSNETMLAVIVPCPFLSGPF